MENKVGTVVPQEKDVEALLKEIAALDAKVAKYVDVHLSNEERRNRLKFRAGGEQVVALVGRLAGEQGVTLRGFSVEDMNADLTLTERLRPVLAAVEALQKRLDDGLLQAETECWTAATSFYSILDTMASRDPQVAAALTPANDFFARRRRRAEPATAQPTPAPVK